MEVIQPNTIEYLETENKDFEELILLSSWELDGSSGHSQYNQQFSNLGANGSDLLATTTTPLHLYMLKNDTNSILSPSNLGVHQGMQGCGFKNQS